MLNLDSKRPMYLCFPLEYLPHEYLPQKPEQVLVYLKMQELENKSENSSHPHKKPIWIGPRLANVENFDWIHILSTEAGYQSPVKPRYISNQSLLLYLTRVYSDLFLDFIMGTYCLDMYKDIESYICQTSKNSKGLSDREEKISCRKVCLILKDRFLLTWCLDVNTLTCI